MAERLSLFQLYGTLKQKMKQMAAFSVGELQKMREQSHSLGQIITPITWSKQLMKTKG